MVPVPSCSSRVLDPAELLADHVASIDRPPVLPMLPPVTVAQAAITLLVAPVYAPDPVVLKDVGVDGIAAPQDAVLQMLLYN